MRRILGTESLQRVVVDASVWVSRLTNQASSATSRRWLERQGNTGLLTWVPNLCLAEVAGAIARLSGDPLQGLNAVRIEILRFPHLRVVPLDETLGNRAMELAAHLRLRGSDAVYVATAESLAVPLVTWDHVLLQRAEGVVQVLPPS